MIRFALILFHLVEPAFPVSPGVEQYLRRDQNFNLPSRLTDDIVLTASDKKWKPMKWTQIKASHVRFFSASDEDTRSFGPIFRRLDNGNYLMPNYVNPDGHQTHGGPTDQAIGKYTRLLGRRTVFFTSNEHEGFLKFSPTLMNDPVQFVKFSNSATKYTRQVIKVLGAPRTFAIVEEPFAAVIDGGGMFDSGGDGYGIIVRSKREWDRADSEGAQVDSLHSLFGCADCLKDIAAKARMEPNEWILNEYIPKFAPMLAEAHVKYGFVFESHTQNTLVVTGSDGRILRFLNRDLAGLVADPTPATLADPSVDISFLADPNASKLYTHFVAAGKLKARDFGVHFSMYTIQSIDRISESLNRLSLGRAFLRHYRAEVERQTGAPLLLSPDGEEAWNTFMKATSLGQLTRKWEFRGIFRDSVGFLMEEIYSAVQQKRLTGLIESMDFADAKPLNSSLEIRAAFEQGTLIFTSPSARAQVEQEFKFSFKRLFNNNPSPLSIISKSGRAFIVDQSLKRILAYTIERKRSPPATCTETLTSG